MWGPFLGQSASLEGTELPAKGSEGRAPAWRAASLLSLAEGFCKHEAQVGEGGRGGWGFSGSQGIPAIKAQDRPPPSPQH